MKKFIFLAAGLLFIACSSPNPPKWYNKIYNDNNYFIYATGEGNTKQQAVKNALANAGAKISIIVKSTYKSLKYQYKSNNISAYSNNSILNIETKTNPITFSKYKILKLQKDDKYYVLLEIDRIKNAKNMCNNIQISETNSDLINIFLHYKKIVLKLNKKITELKNINALYPLCKNKLKKIINLKKDIIKKYNNLNIYIISNNQNIKNIIENILNIKTSSIKPDIKIFINQKTGHKTVGNYKITKIYLNITIKEKNKSKNYSLICAASSIQDFKTAKELAYQECKKKLKKLFNY